MALSFFSPKFLLLDLNFQYVIYTQFGTKFSSLLSSDSLMNVFALEREINTWKE